MKLLSEITEAMYKPSPPGIDLVTRKFYVLILKIELRY